MPRGIPNARRDEDGLKYTTFYVPLAANPKHMVSSYMKNESQTMWARNAQKKAQSRTRPEEGTVPQETRRGSQVIVIHPGSQSMRIGKASDVFPITVPSVVARKITPASNVSAPIYRSGIIRRRQEVAIKTEDSAMDEYAVTVNSDDPFEEKMGEVIVSLRDRMRFYKLRVTPNAANAATTFNEQFQPETISEHNDAFQLEWIQEGPDVLIGEKALRLADPQASGYIVRSPLHGSSFNVRDYGSSVQSILSDIEILIRQTLQEKMGIQPRDFKDYSVLLVIPDLYERSYLRELSNLLLVTMGFKQLCAQQESLAATYGAGLSNACVVDIGAVKTSIACVDEGLVVADTRLILNMGGNDITEFLSILLKRIRFPYKEFDLSRAYDWSIFEDLKARMSTLSESDVTLSTYDFIVRHPFKPAKKYSVRAYDETILAPMIVFEPRMIDFEKKRQAHIPMSNPDVTDEIIDHNSDQITSAMLISTQHLMPANGTTKMPAGAASASAAPRVDGDPPAAPERSPSSEDKGKKSKHPGGFDIDVADEASRLPLDVAIFNSTRAAGGDDKIRKYLQAVLIIGGGANVPGMNHGLESRLQAIATPLVADMEKVQIIPPPKEVDPTVLAWKGAAVLAKMEGVSELWVTQADWDILGIRGLKERCFFL
ncbi:unnamed protein product [Mycena citricolor]|uniref:Actin-related protein 8 n=1 Tax=Mycena citricolor TaxID=2018698 RepID=A0AAD2HZN6_9AGAR|nr:unnamed protein product [Mycena citricolor]